jgi:DNA-binding response OmpR family regulator/predicted  nucleic acid-binding Zn-ribbon protein
MPKVLIFESDNRFADELKRGLEQQSCAVTVVGDATEGLQLAANDRPDLILLTVELPRVNGFSVCNKLKRDPGLKSVPLIIMSSDSNEDTFSQHRRLKHSRAEDYVHKPIGFVDLLPRIRALVPLEDEETVELDAHDEVVHIGEEGDEPATPDGYVEVDPDSNEDTQFDTEIEAELQDVESLPPESGVDSEVDEFTENAFDALLDEDQLAAQAVTDVEEDPDTKVDATRSLLPLADSVRPSVTGRPISSVPVSPRAVNSRSSAPVSQRPAHSRHSDLTIPRISESEALAALDPRALAERDDAIGELQELLAASQADADRQRAEISALVQRRAELERELASTREARSSQPNLPAPGGPSPQEFLSLREALNKKDKEILDLRGQLSAKSKELLAVKDTSLDHEREKAEAVDRALQLERELHDLGRERDVAKADKEQAAKRADDFKRRAEKLAGESQEREHALSALREQLAAAEQRRSAQLAEAGERLEQALAAAEQNQAHALAEAAQRMDAALAAAEQGKQEALAAAEQGKQEALAEAEQSKQDAVEEAAQDAEELLSRALETTRNAHASELANAVNAERQSGARNLAEALEHQEARLRTEYEQALATLAEEKAGEYRALETERDAVLERAEHDISAARAATRELSSQLAGVQHELAETREQLDATRAALQQESGRLAALQAELGEAREHLEATRFELEHEQADHGNVRAALAQRDQQLQDTRQELSSVQSELMTLRQEFEQREHDLARARGEFETLHGQFAQAEQDLTAARQHLARLEGELNESNAELAASRADAMQLQEEFTRVQAKASAALSKWEQDRDAIHKGREALQQALEQLTQIESRPLN